MLRQIFSGYGCPIIIVVNKFTTHIREKNREGTREREEK